MKRHSESVRKVSAFFAKRLGLILGLIGILFTWFALMTFSKLLHLIGGSIVNLPTVIRDNLPSVSYQLALSAYASSWFFGFRADLALQEDSYDLVANRKLVEKTGNVLAAIFLVAAALLPVSLFCFDRTIFWWSVFGFVIVDWFGWKWLMVHRLGPTYHESKSLIRQRKEPGYVKDVIKLEIVRDYVAGRWKILRYSTMMVIAILALWLSYYPDFYSVLSNKFSIPAFVVQSVPFWVYVLIAEGWMWQNRLRCQFCCDQIEEIIKPESDLWELQLPENK